MRSAPLTSRRSAARWLILTIILISALAVHAQDASSLQAPAPLQQTTPSQPTGNTGDLTSFLGQLQVVAIRLPLAALLGAALAFRPRRRGTPLRSAPVIQTQIVLSIIGALVMLIVGASLARAFGVVGVAGLIRYRAKVEDPKDASVMLAALSVGLASGVGLYLIAIFGTVFAVAVLSLIESIEPDPYKLFSLKVTSKQSENLQPRIEQLLRRSHAKFELRALSTEEISYKVQLPVKTHTDGLSKAIVQLDEASAVEWDEHKKKDKA